MTTVNVALSIAVTALVADVVRRGEEVGKVVHAEMTALEQPVWDALVAAGAMTAEEVKGAFIEYESILEFGDHVAVFYDIPETMPGDEWDQLSLAVHFGDVEAQAKMDAYMALRAKCLRVEPDGTWIAL